MSEDTNAAATEGKAEKVVKSVTMQDGRVVEFVGKRKLLKESIIDENSNSVSVRLDFANGETRLVPIPAALLLRAAAHGWEQKLGDETAGVSDVDDQTIAVDELIERLVAGQWTTVRTSSGVSGTSVLFKALCQVFTNKTAEEVKAFLKTKTQAEKLALRNSSKLKPIIEAIEAEKAAGSAVNTDALLGELG